MFFVKTVDKINITPVKIFEFCKRLKCLAKVKNDGYENYL